VRWPVFPSSTSTTAIGVAVFRKLANAPTAGWRRPAYGKVRRRPVLDGLINEYEPAA
jgi:hypothetical protein